MKVSDHGLVLAACGDAAATAALLARTESALAALLGLPCRRLEPAGDPARALAAMTALGDPAGASATAAGPTWLAALPLDPGLTLPGGGHWAEALGAWRQPTLLLLDGAQLATGLPAAATALLERWRVPLVGLVQCGGAAAWREQERRSDGLPWLGWLAGAGEGAADAAGEAEGDPSHPGLVPALRLRWQGCLAERS